jgi:hypothetical protein
VGEIHSEQITASNAMWLRQQLNLPVDLTYYSPQIANVVLRNQGSALQGMFRPSCHACQQVVPNLRDVGIGFNP